MNKKLQELEEMNKNNNYIIKGKLQEKDDQIKGLEDNMNLMKEEMTKIFTLIQHNPVLVNIKPEVLGKID